MVADEVSPRTAGRRGLHAIGRAPLLVLTYLVSRASTKPVADLNGDLERSGFAIATEARSRGDAFTLVVARKEGSA